MATTTQNKGTRYVEVPADGFHTFMESIGFTTVEIEGSEKVYVRVGVRNPNLIVKVYSSIARNAADARDCGQDAIRVSLYQRFPERLKKRDRCLKKTSRVYRTGSPEAVYGRTKERVEELFSWAKEKINTNLCRNCGTVTWKKGGKCLDNNCQGWAQ